MYEQGTDARLLAALFEYVDNKTVIDAGAEHGEFTRLLLEQGAEAVFDIEPYPPNVAALRERFGSDARVRIVELALSDRDGEATLNLIADREGINVSSYHSLAHATETALIHKTGEMKVECRTLDSLMREGVLPRAVGILKIDAEGHDLAILRGMGELAAAVVMIEFWDDLPEAMGKAQFKLIEAWDVMCRRGYRHVVLIRRRDEFETVEIDDPRTRPGDWGNAIFLHGGAFAEVPSLVFQLAADAHAQLIDKAVYFKTHCHLRMKVIEEQSVALEHFRRAAPAVKPDTPAPRSD